MRGIFQNSIMHCCYNYSRFFCFVNRNQIEEIRLLVAKIKNDREESRVNSVPQAVALFPYSILHIDMSKNYKKFLYFTIC